jgi:hypothetical protein
MSTNVIREPRQPRPVSLRRVPLQAAGSGMGWRLPRGAARDVRLGGQVRVARSPELQRASSVSQLGHGGRETAKENLLYAECARAPASLVSWAEETRALAEGPVLKGACTAPPASWNRGLWYFTNMGNGSPNFVFMRLRGY